MGIENINRNIHLDNKKNSENGNQSIRNNEQEKNSLFDSNISNEDLNKHIKQGLFKESSANYEDFKNQLFSKGKDSNMTSINGIGNNYSHADKFDDWTNDKSNYQDVLNGGNGGEFQMFEFNPNSYSKDLKEFSKEYIDKFDDDKDGQWNREEFKKMAANGAELTKEMDEMLNKAFDGLNLDDKKEAISPEEFASQLYITDLDLNNYAKTLNAASSLDGKFTFDEYQGKSSIMPGDKGFETLQKQKADFFNHFYNNK